MWSWRGVLMLEHPHRICVCPAALVEELTLNEHKPNLSSMCAGGYNLGRRWGWKWRGWNQSQMSVEVSLWLNNHHPVRDGDRSHVARAEALKSWGWDGSVPSKGLRPHPKWEQFWSNGWCWHSAWVRALAVAVQLESETQPTRHTACLSTSNVCPHLAPEDSTSDLSFLCPLQLTSPFSLCCPHPGMELYHRALVPMWAPGTSQDRSSGDPVKERDQGFFRCAACISSCNTVHALLR